MDSEGGMNVVMKETKSETRGILNVFCGGYVESRVALRGVVVAEDSDQPLETCLGRELIFAA